MASTSSSTTKFPTPASKLSMHVHLGQTLCRRLPPACWHTALGAERDESVMIKSCGVRPSHQLRAHGTATNAACRQAREVLDAALIDAATGIHQWR